MRSRPTTILTAILAVLSITAFAATTASASLPEMLTKGVWPVTYASESGEVTLQTTEKLKGFNGTIHCLASRNGGEISSFKSFAKVHITYTGCKAASNGAACTSKGAAAGEIVTNHLKAELVYTNKAAKEVGQVFKPEAAGGALAEYACSIYAIKLTGAVIAKLPNEQVNKLRTSFTWNYRQAAGIQEPTEYEEGATKVSAFLTSFSGEQTGEAATETMSLSTSVEIHA
jgi:hypothetical protein